MPINSKMSYEEIVQEIMDSYKNKGKIGNIKPKSVKHALRIANAIANRMEQEKSKKKNKRV